MASVRGELSDLLVDFVHSTSEPMPLEPEIAEFRAAPVTAPAPLVAAEPELAEDDEMREVFLEEAREVLQDAGSATDGLAGAPSDVALLTTVRRAFHTLKGSSRMVGLKEFGEAAWACEQIYNTQLAESRPAEPALIDFTRWVLVDGRLGRGHRPAPRWRSQCRRHQGRGAAPASGEAPVPTEPAETAVPLTLAVPELPSAQALELPAAVPQPEPALPEVSFEIDLSALDAPASAPTPFEPQATQPLPLAETPAPAMVDLSLDLIDLDLGGEPVVAAPAPEPAMEAAASVAAPSDDDNVKVVGPLRIGIPLFNIYLNEADELSRRLTTEVAEWAMELHRPIGETPIALAHSLAGSSATVGFNELSQLARALEHAQTRSQAIGYGTPDEARLFVDTAEEIRRLLHQFAAGFLKEPAPELLQRRPSMSSNRRAASRRPPPRPTCRRPPAWAPSRTHRCSSASIWRLRRPSPLHPPSRPPSVALRRSRPAAWAPPVSASSTPVSKRSVSPN
ncbi:hypothetical protein FSC37_02810 [Piscinibacter aquaticus]|uniref:HPt domain-containing protein n=1 Tax=Piscinibacter aquaticus TaxID=392597 RepID=A0A5C6U0R5_9BURK|nr:hypothetical protein FSC37_02810 [Piscinibacter aquaticus]